MASSARRFSGPSDLHLHSDRSDGTETPAEVMAAAAAAGVRTASLTDHDTTSGWSEAGDAATRQGMTFVPGMELSSRHEWRSIHVLGYLFDPADAHVVALTEGIRASRLGRARAIAEQIARDFPLTWDDVLAHATPGATVGRPHIADALVARGHVPDRSAAFAGILAPDSPYYVSMYAPETFDAVAAVTEAGGVAVIAHPASRAGVPSARFVEDLIEAGLAGLELDHRDNGGPLLQELRTLAARRDLIVTGSSDYHGRGKPNLPGENVTSDDAVARIIALGTGSAPRYPQPRA